jgi:hypothetical protein
MISRRSALMQLLPAVTLCGRFRADPTAFSAVSDTSTKDRGTRKVRPAAVAGLFDPARKPDLANESDESLGEVALKGPLMSVAAAPPDANARAEVKRYVCARAGKKSSMR